METCAEWIDLNVVVHTREAMGALIARDAEKWVTLVKLAGIGQE